MDRDLRDTAIHREIEAVYARLRQADGGQIVEAAEVLVSRDGDRAVFSGTITDKLDGRSKTRICRINLSSGRIEILTSGPNADHSPKYSPDGRVIAFVSDRRSSGNFQLYLLDVASGTTLEVPSVPGWIEYIQWSSDGRRLLLGVAAHGAETAGVHGAALSKEVGVELPTWMPIVVGNNDDHRWRSVWIYEIDSNRMRPASPRGINVWEAVWCGTSTIAAVTSDGPTEDLWYRANLSLLNIEHSEVFRVLYVPRDQLGCLAASPAGTLLFVVEALCSDRGLVAGEPRVIDARTGEVRHLDASGLDVTYGEWCSERRLLVAGHRGFETVVGRYDVSSPTFTEVWASQEISSSGRYISVSGFGEDGDCVIVAEAFDRAPQIGVVRNGQYRTVKSFDCGYSELAAGIGSISPVSWIAPDGLEIQGWLLRPKDRGPHPLVMAAHGGPVWQWHPMCLQNANLAYLLLIRRGMGIFMPNPRGSTGRGRGFVAGVLGDMGGADAQDCLSGLDNLVKQGVADPQRIGITGRSYGGYLTAWLITQQQRFAAAIPVCPFTNLVTEHLTSNIPAFMSLFMQDTYSNIAGRYFDRSPILHAHRAKTPTLSICGALDRCTPPGEALQFHNALLENGVKSVLVTYPEEGHGVRQWPAMIDYTARVVTWFEEHMRPAVVQH